MILPPEPNWTRTLALVLVGAVAVKAAACTTPGPSSPGGATTVDDRTSNAFSLPAPNLTAAELAEHLRGDVAFDATFVSGAAPVHGGLGARFNNTACAGCHNRDGRGRATAGDGPTSQALVRLSLADGTPEVPGGVVPVPGHGTQLQDHAVFGVAPEGHVGIAWRAEPGAYGDGEPYVLRRPAVTITVAGTALDPGVLTSLRMAPAVFGLGLLEAIDEATLAALADPDDADRDGISGRLNVVWDPQAGATRVGRFGVKANTSDLLLQTAAAYANDMGIGNAVVADSDAQRAELAPAVLDAAAFYVRTLAVPARAPLTA
ncbi:MAG: thiol oxidoreductase, partial [Myxococcota bacterium]|nr:thiol oxidoreductase [Myxococcota bacterium]